MKQYLLTMILGLTTMLGQAQITINQSDYGQAGDSIVVGYDAPSTLINVGGTGLQTWDFTGLSLNNINTLNFVDPANTLSGSEFPNADLAIERQSDTLFFRSSTSNFEIDGLAGEGFGLPGVSVVADFNPNSTQVTFPSTMNTTFVDTAVFDTVVDCASFNISLCDSARVQRILIGTSSIDAYGDVETPGGTYTSIRQYYREDNKDSIWIKVFGSWTFFDDSLGVVHNYRWMANNEDWPVVSATADSQNGNILTAEFKIDENVLAFVDATQHPQCNGDCNGSATVSAVGGLPPYTYAWPASAASQTTATATALCAGTYTVTITDSDTGSYELEVELVEPSVITIAGSIQGVNTGSDGAIDIAVVGGVGGFSYAWSGPDGYTSTDEDPADLIPGEYTVVVTDGNGCTASMTFTVELTGISTVGQEGFKIFPNPSNDVVYVQGRNIISSFILYDLEGREILRGAPASQMMEVAVRNLDNGLYLLRAESVQGTHLARIVVGR